jgi:hypothetical protein
MLRAIQLIVGLLLLIATEILHVFFIMPMPGSQESNTIEIAYFIHKNIFYIRTIGLLIVIVPLIHYYMNGKWLARILVTVGIVAYGYVFYKFNYVFVADKIFEQPTKYSYAGLANNVIKPQQLVVGVEVNGKAKAYPIQLIGYHHQVRDTIDNEHIMVTYCTVCRTGRVFKPIVNNRPEEFRLVGMDHFNAMFEDASTGSWWRQVNGEAVVGPMKGATLAEIPSTQMTLRGWLELYPESLILQPDTIFNDSYEWLEPFDKGKMKSYLEKKDSLSWNEKSWIVGVQLGMQARAYDWEDLLRLKVINDTVDGVPLVVSVESDSASFHVWKRDSLSFTLKDSLLIDDQTSSVWTWQGKAVSGELAGQKLSVVQSYQEHWHSWRTFRPQSTKYEPKK